MELVNSLLNVLEPIFRLLDGEETRVWATRIFVFAVTIDFVLSHDNLVENSIREWMLKISQKHFYILGAVTPYAFGMLLGHFYHPTFTEKFVPQSGYWNLASVIGIGLALALINRLFGIPKHKHLALIPIFGVLVGSFIWPVIITPPA